MTIAAMRRTAWWALPGASVRRRSWAGGVDMALVSVFLLLVVNNLVISAGPLQAALASSNVVGQVGVVAAIVGLAGPLLWSLSSRTLPPRVILGGVTLVWAGQLADTVSIRTPQDLTDAWWALQVTAPVCLLLFALVPWRYALPAGLLLVGTYGFCRAGAVTGPAHRWTSAVADMAVLVDYSLVGRLVVPALRKVGAMADKASARRAQQHVKGEADLAEARALRLADRLLHDEVIHCLRALSMPPAAMPHEVLAQLCETTQVHLSQASTTSEPGVPSGLRRLLQGIAQQIPVGVRVNCDPDLFLPPEVSAAISGAAGEALRNVYRHAGTGQARIDADDHGGEIHVIVSDRGVGFDPTAAHGMGIASSITARMAEVGGTSSIESVPGYGTTVALKWRPPIRPAAELRGLLDPGQDRVRLIVGTVVPATIFSLVQLGLHYDQVANPATASAAVLLNFLAVIAALAMCARSGMSGPAAFALCVLAVVTAWIGGWGIPTSAHLDVAYFAAGASAPGLALVAFVRPAREALVGCAAATVTVVLMIRRVNPTAAALMQGLPAVTACVFTVGVVLVARLILDRIGRVISRDQEMAKAEVVTQLRAQAAAKISTARLQRVHAWVSPLLAGISTGAAGIGADRTVIRARTLEAAVRDDIRLGTLISEPLRVAIAQVRSAGGFVEVLAGQDVTSVDQQLITDMVMPLLTGAILPSSVVLTCGHAQQVSVLIRPRAGEDLINQILALTGATAVWGSDYTLLRSGDDGARSPQAGTWHAADAEIGSAT